MHHQRLTDRQARNIRAGYAMMLRFSQERRAKFLAERELRAGLKAHQWSDLAVAELIEANRRLANG
jgi:hypothetical protein